MVLSDVLKKESLFPIFFFFFLKNPPPTEFSPLPLPAALPIWRFICGIEVRDARPAKAAKEYVLTRTVRKSPNTNNLTADHDVVARFPAAPARNAQTASVGI